MIGYTGARSQGSFWQGQQHSKSDLSLCTKFSSGSGGGLDQAIDAARASEEMGDGEDSETVEDVRCSCPTCVPPLSLAHMPA